MTQGGAGVATRVSILAGTKRLATVTAKANGSFTYAVPKASKATTFRATRGRRRPRRAGGLRASSRSLGFPCVNPTISGFTAASGTVRIR